MSNSMRYANPYAVQGHWYKGNLHTHTTQSDGRLTPEEAIRWYEQNGYDFVALTDHDTYIDITPLQQATRLTLIPGFEYSCGIDPRAHILCLAVRQTYRGIYQDVLTATHALGGMAIFVVSDFSRRMIERRKKPAEKPQPGEGERPASPESSAEGPTGAAGESSPQEAQDE